MIQPKNTPLISGTQFVAIVVLTIAVFLIVDFGRRATAGYYVAQAEKQLKADIHAELALRAELEARREYVISDEYIEKWAREQAHMVRPGDQSMILITPQGPGVPVETLASQDRDDTVRTVPNWYHWWRLFFDVDPWSIG